MLAHEAEKSLLYCCITDRSAFYTAREMVNWDDFSKTENQTIFRCLCSLNTEEWNVVSIGRHISAEGFGRAIGGSNYLLEIATADFTTASVHFWAKTVKKESLERQREKLIKNQNSVNGIDETLFISELSRIKAEIERLDESQDSISLRVLERIENNINNPMQTIKTPWNRLDVLSQYTMAGTVCLFCGNAGASKSFMVLQLCSNLLEQGIKFSIFELEDTSDFHIIRALAQRHSLAGLTSPDWCKMNPEIARQAYMDVDFVNALGASMSDSPDKCPTLEGLASWAEARASDGARFIIIDPVSLAKKINDRIYKEDENFVDSIKKTAARHNSTMLLVTHPVKGCSAPDMGQIAGGAVYSRACHTVLWLQNHDVMSSDVLTSCGTDPVDHNRTLHLLKSRNGAGQGKRLAFDLDKDSLTLKEYGVIVKKPKK